MDYGMLGTVILGVIIAMLIGSLIFALLETAQGQILGGSKAATA